MPRKHNVETAKVKILNTILVTESGCWEWQGPLNSNGYGRLRILNQNLAHRVSFCVFVGPLLSSKMYVCHKCDNPPCINPAHLFIGDQKVNMHDCSVKKRTRNQMTGITHCKRGHEFTPENTQRQMNGRHCRICYKKNRKDADERKRLKQLAGVK